MTDAKLKAIVSNFSVKEDIIELTAHGNGHINDTYVVNCNNKRYILQKMNRNVFTRPWEAMSNIENVIDFLHNKGVAENTVMTLIKANDGKMFYEDSDGEYWRVYDFIENAVCLEKPDSKEDFYECAYAFGSFQRLLSDFPAEKLYETIKDFHNTPKRYNDFLKAVDEDVCGRANGVLDEIQFVKARTDFYGVLLDANRDGVLPLRVTHNDTKINNVMLSKTTRKALCVIDLDTIMPGFSVTDFGDAIRFGANTASEDEPDLSKVKLDLDLFDAYAKGFIDGCGGALTESEIMLLPEGAKMMAVECGIRFLTDYLQGDTYFKTKYAEHNLVRCRTQFKLVLEMERHWQEMKDIVKKYARG